MASNDTDLAKNAVKKANDARQDEFDHNARFGAGSPIRIISTAINGAAGGNAAGGLTNLVQASAVNVLQSLTATEVKRLADSLFDKDGNSTTESEFVRTALQGLAGCASGAAGGSSDCGSAAIGASASVIVNLLISSIANDNSADDEPRFDADGNLINPLSLEEQQARTNLVTTIIAGIATTSGIDAAGAVTAAQIETENNQNKPGSVGPGNTSFDTSCREVGQGPCGGLPLDRFKDVQEGDVLPNGKIVTAEDVKFYRDQYNDVFNSLYAYNGAPPTEAQVLIGLEVIIEGGLIEQRFANFVQSFGGLNELENRLAAGGVSAAELAQKYISYERLKAVAFKETPLADISHFENDPAAFDALVKSDPQRAALIQLAVAYVNENTTTAIFAGEGSFGDRLRVANDGFDLVTRGLGLAQFVFSGAAAIATGSATVASLPVCGATGAGCLGTAVLGTLTAVETDQSLAGFRTFFSGDSTNSFLAQGANALTGIDADKADIILGLGAGGASIAVGVRSGVKLADEGVENLDLAGSFGNAAEISDEALAAARIPQVTFNQIAGSTFERQVLDALGHVGATKNTLTKPVRLADGSVVSTIVDAAGREVGGLLEIKNVLELSFSPQIRAQLQLATDTGIPLNIIVNPRTNRVTAELQKQVKNTGGGVFVLDPITGVLSPFGG